MMAVLLFVVALAVIAALLAVTRRVGTWDRRA
jgi:hypothetical protein